MEEALQKNSSLWELFDAITLLQGSDEVGIFFRDLCTAYELEAMAERWQVAQMIDEGIPYRKISSETGASTATITRIAHWLKRGEGGYRLMLDRTRGNQDRETEAVATQDKANSNN
jgi:TrpR-related protein YerC/YecD